MRPPFLILNLSLLISLCACSVNSNPSGDGAYSYARADFVELATGADARATGALTDDGARLTFRPAAAVKWATTPDTTYRALLYYNDRGTAAVDTNDIISAAPVPTARLRAEADVQDKTTDPVRLESAWVSRSGKYLNIGLYIKTGKSPDSDKLQQLGLMLTRTEQDAEGHTHYYIRLLHAQNGQPEYYSAHTYISAPITHLEPHATLHLSANTYDGERELVVHTTD